jgi:hypothetical protein
LRHAEGHRVEGEGKGEAKKRRKRKKEKKSDVVYSPERLDHRSAKTAVDYRMGCVVE